MIIGTIALLFFVPVLFIPGELQQADAHFVRKEHQGDSHRGRFRQPLLLWQVCKEGTWQVAQGLSDEIVGRESVKV